MSTPTNKVTQARFAHLIGCGVDTIKKIESGKSRVPVWMAISIQEKTGASFLNFVGGPVPYIREAAGRDAMGKKYTRESYATHIERLKRGDIIQQSLEADVLDIENLFRQIAALILADYAVHNSAVASVFRIGSAINVIGEDFRKYREMESRLTGKSFATPTLAEEIKRLSQERIDANKAKAEAVQQISKQPAGPALKPGTVLIRSGTVDASTNTSTGSAVKA